MVEFRKIREIPVASTALGFQPCANRKSDLFLRIDIRYETGNPTLQSCIFKSSGAILKIFGFSFRSAQTFSMWLV